MKYYLLSLDAADPRAITYVPSTEIQPKWPWPKERWSPLTGLYYLMESSSGLYDEETLRELPKITALVRPQVDELPDMIGQFSFLLVDLPPLISLRLRDMLEEFAPGCCQYVEPPRIWNEPEGVEVDNSNYVYANFVKQLDGWDHEKSEVLKKQSRNGATFFSLSGRGVVNEAAVNGHHLWRDKFTKHVLCSETFKDHAEAAGISGFYFEPTKD